MKRFQHTEQHLSRGGPTGKLIQPSSSLQCDMLLSGTGSCTVDWGDGTTTTKTLGTDTSFSRTYSSGAERTIRFFGKITSLRSGTTFGCGGDVADLPSEMTYINVGGTNTLSGDVAGLPRGITYLRIEGSNTVGGNVVGLPGGLELLICFGFNTLSGDVAGLPSGLEFFSIFGSNTLSGDVADLPSVMTYLRVAGTNTLSGDAGDLPSGMTYFSVAGSNTLTVSDTMPTGLGYVLIDRALSQPQVDAVLSAMWANRDAPKPISDRTIDINFAGSSAPSAAGLLVKADLQAYRSPNNDPTKSLWTVLTN